MTRLEFWEIMFSISAYRGNRAADCDKFAHTAVEFREEAKRQYDYESSTYVNEEQEDFFDQG